MSDGLIWLTWTNFPGKGSELAVLMAIAEACNSHGNGHCHIAELAGAARRSPSTVFVVSQFDTIQRLEFLTKVGVQRSAVTDVVPIRVL
jgi:hypothetical protein